MQSQGGQASKEERVLVICVDRDNDVGRKAGVKTPIVGKKENIDAALKLLLNDPEEADANAMFEAVRICESLERGSSKVSCEVATITGSELGGITADRKLVSELNEVIEEFKPSSLILVTDGYSDEDILPLIQSRIPVSSVRRVIVRHSKTIEETAALFSRYLRKIAEDPRYSRMFLGLPGILLIMLSVLSLLAVFVRYDIGTWAWIIGLMIIGSYLIGKGYGLDRKISSIFSRISAPHGLVLGSSMVFGVLLMAVGLYQSISQIISNPNVLPNPPPSEPEAWLALIPRLLGLTISTSITILVIGFSVILLGRALAHLLERDPRFWRTIVLIALCAWSWKIFSESAEILINPMLPLEDLVISIVIGVIIVAILMPITHFLGKRYRDFFRRNNSVKTSESEGAHEEGRRKD